MLTDAELLREIHAALLRYLKQEAEAEETIDHLIGLYEDNGRQFIGSADYPAND